MKQSVPVLIIFLGVVALTACSGVPSQAPSTDAPISAVPNCTPDYAEKRNKIVTEVSVAFLNIDLTRIMTEGDLPENLEVDPAQNSEKLATVRKKLDLFLNENKNVVCKGLVLKCKPEYDNDPQCYRNYYQSDWVEKIISNESLVAAHHSLEIYFSKL